MERHTQAARIVNNIKKNMLKNIVFIVAISCLIVSCKTKSSSESTSENTATSLVKAPAFSGDSAYNYIEAQVKFGPRVPNTSAHLKAGDYLVQKLKQVEIGRAHV